MGKCFDTQMNEVFETWWKREKNLDKMHSICMNLFKTEIIINYSI